MNVHRMPVGVYRSIFSFALLFLYLESAGWAQVGVTTYAGTGVGGYSGDNGPAINAQFQSPGGVAVDGGGNLYIADTYNHRVRKVTPGGFIETVAGNGTSGLSGDGGLATAASLYYPNGVAVDSAGNLYIADGCNGRVRKVTPGGIISSVTTEMFAFCYDYYYYYYYYDYVYPAGSVGMAFDSAGNLFVGDVYNYQIRRISTTGVVSTVAGNGTYGFTGDGVQATSTRITYPYGIAIDASGNLLFSDSDNHRIRRVTPQGIISTVAGSSAGFSGDGGQAASARLNYPTGIALDNTENLFIVDASNYRIRRMRPDGIIETVAGKGTSGFSGDGGPAIAASFSWVVSVAADALGNLFISDSGNRRIRKVGSLLPRLTSVSPDVVGQGATLDVTFLGEFLPSSLTIDAGSGIAVSNVRVLGSTTVIATLAIAPDANLGARSVTVTTSAGITGPVALSVLAPFPDLSVTLSHTGSFGVGFNGVYAIAIRNVGSVATTAPLTVTDTLPSALSYVSGTGTGWSCSTAAKIVTCVNSESLSPGATTALSLTVAVSSGGPTQIANVLSVESAGDPFTSNNGGSDATTVVATPSPSLAFNPQLVKAGQNSSVGITLPAPFPFDVTGTLTLAFAPNAILDADDPAIAFATGGRQASFIIPANTLQARFGTNPAGPVLFQPGTVAGTLTFSGILNAGTEQRTVAGSATIPRAAPVIQQVRTSPEDGVTALVTLLSTSREITQLTLSFISAKEFRVSCGSAPGCTANGSSLTFDVTQLFSSWYSQDTTHGSLVVLRLPISIKGEISGTALLRLSSRYGSSPATAVNFNKSD